MTLLAPPVPHDHYARRRHTDHHQPGGDPGRQDFQFALATSSLVVLAILAGVVVFLTAYGWKALKVGGLSFITDPTWSPDSGHFGAMSLLVGSVAIAVVAVIIATPISLAAALMINEYAPVRIRGVLTGAVDCSPPSRASSTDSGDWRSSPTFRLHRPSGWWAISASCPFFRTPTPGEYVQSIFACGLISAVTIIPIITSVSREVMSQTPRDACEAALGLGGTRWGMVTDVIMPFSRNGVVGAVLLGFGRGIGETMVVVLILSKANHMTAAMFGPNGLGSIAKQITEDFPTGTPMDKSALILLGLVLFVTVLLVNIGARAIVNRGQTGS